MRALLIKQMNLLHNNWFVAKTNWESARDEMDKVMRTHLEGHGPLPTEFMAANVSDLLFLMQDAWIELNDFLQANASDE